MTKTLLADLSAALADQVRAAAPSIVALRSGRAHATGFRWDDKLIVTADELIEDDSRLRITLPGGEETDGSLVGRDHTTDVALIRIARDLPALPKTQARLEAGALALAIGAEGGLPRASVAALAYCGPAWRSLRGGRIDSRIELTGRIPAASEGAPVIDVSGGLIGMAVRSRRRTLVIPASTIDRVAPLLADRGFIPRGYLGLGLHPVRLPDGGHGAMIMAVDDGGPGAKAGLHQGDVITALNGQPIGGLGSLVAELGPDSVGRTVSLGVSLAGAARAVDLTIAERPRG